MQIQKDKAPIHPGQILLQTLKQRQITKNVFAHRLGIRPQRVTDIIGGRMPVTTKIAVLLAAALRTDEDYWLDLQREYEKGLLNANRDFQKHVQLVKQDNTQASTYRVGLRYTNDQVCAGLHSHTPRYKAAGSRRVK